jgi:hypothetical protein
LTPRRRRRRKSKPSLPIPRELPLVRSRIKRSPRRPLLLRSRSTKRRNLEALR